MRVIQFFFIVLIAALVMFAAPVFIGFLFAKFLWNLAMPLPDIGDTGQPPR